MFVKLLQIIGILPTEEEKREKRNAQSLRLLEQENAAEPTSYERNRNYFLELLARSDSIGERKSVSRFRSQRIRDNKIAISHQLHFKSLKKEGQENKD